MENITNIRRNETSEIVRGHAVMHSDLTPVGTMHRVPFTVPGTYEEPQQSSALPHPLPYQNHYSQTAGHSANLYAPNARSANFAKYGAPTSRYAPQTAFTNPAQTPFTGRASTLPISAPYSTPYLLSSQPHFLRLPEPHQAMTGYGMGSKPSQGFSSFHDNLHIPNTVMKQQTAGEVVEPDSSSPHRDLSSHINRKKRKACGRCGPCQRKDNCGTCMNCVNRAKGKQICIFRKCEELKKKPGAESYVLPHERETDIPLRQEKRKNLEQFISTDRKRGKTEDKNGLSTLHSAPSHLGFQSQFTAPFQQQGFDQQPLLANPTSTSKPPQQYSSSPVLIDDTPVLHQNRQINGPSDTTDIISEALREIENHSNSVSQDVQNLSAINPTLNFAGNSEGIPVSNYLEDNSLQSQRWNLQPIQSESQLSTSLSSGNQSLLDLVKTNSPDHSKVNLPTNPGQTTSYNALVQPKPGHFAPTQDLPDQLLRNLTRFNEFKSFNKNNFSQGNNKAPFPPSEGSNFTSNMPEKQYHTVQSFVSHDYSNSLTRLNPSQGLANMPEKLSPAVTTHPDIEANPGLMHNIHARSINPSHYHNINPHAQNITQHPVLHSLQSRDRGYLASSEMHMQGNQSITGSVLPQKSFHAPSYHTMTPLLSNSTLNTYQSGFLQSQGIQSSVDPSFHDDMGYIQESQCSSASSLAHHAYYKDVNLPSGVSEGSSRNSIRATSAKCMPSNVPPTPSMSMVIPVVSSTDHQTCSEPDGLSMQNNDYSKEANTGENHPEGIKNTLQPVSQSTQRYQLANTEGKDSLVLLNHKTVSSNSSTHSTMSSSSAQKPEFLGDANSLIASKQTNFSSSEKKTDSCNRLDQGTVDIKEYVLPPVSNATIATSSTTGTEGVSGLAEKHNFGNSVGESFLVKPGSSSTWSNASESQNTMTDFGGIYQTNSIVNPVCVKIASCDRTTSHSDSTTTSIHPLPAARSFISNKDVMDRAHELTQFHKSQQYKKWCARQPLLNSAAPRSTHLPTLISSPNDTCMTISPGESGYDSTEVLVSGEDFVNTQERNNRAEAQTYEVRKIIGDMTSSEASELRKDEPNVNNQNGPKNLHRAPVDQEVETKSSNSKVSYLSSVLPSAGACYSHSLTTATSQQLSYGPKTTLRSMSADIPNTDLQPLHFRRYSCQEMTSEVASRYCDSSVLQSDEVTNSVLSYRNCDTTAIKLKELATSGVRIPDRKKLDFVPVIPPLPSMSSAPEFTNSLSKSKNAISSSPTVQHHNLNGSESLEKDGKMHKPKTQFPSCDCIEGSDGRDDDAPYYTHLGSSDSVLGIRKLFEKRTGYNGSAIRIEKVIYTGKEGKTSRGCPIAKWIIRRSSEEEKVLIICRIRARHRCNNAVVVVIILLWDGVARPLADFAYTNYSTLLPNHGEPTERRCGTNDERTCACQGFDEKTCGASFSFGCSWSMYYNGCKYARSNQPNKYKLGATKNPDAEKFVGKLCERLATVMSPVYKMAAPDAFYNQIEMEEFAHECRLGENEEKNSKPFSGVTACLDFCAHAHKDQHNMDSGSTIVVTLTKPELRTIGTKPQDEQLHVLPLYKLDLTNEFGNFQGVDDKIRTGAIEILNGFRREVRLRNEPRMTKKQKARAKKKRRSAPYDEISGMSWNRRGRPPKRTRSAENLLRSPCDNSPASVTCTPDDERHIIYMREYSNQLRFQTPPHIQRHDFPPSMNAVQQISSSQNNQLPRFRKANPFLHAPTTPKKDEVKVDDATASSAANEHLPSIGSFFKADSSSPGSVSDSMASANTPQIPNDSRDLRSEQLESITTPLPSIEDVVSHPLHRTFAEVKGERSETSSTLSSMIKKEDENSKNIPIVFRENHDMMNKDVSNSNLPTPSTSGNKVEHTNLTEQELIFSDSEENFLHSDIGGVALAPGHGSVLIECAKKELHATTPLLNPNRFHPSRISLVFYQHKNLNTRNHGSAEYGAKEEKRQQQREEKKLKETARIQAGNAETIQTHSSVFNSPDLTSTMILSSTDVSYIKPSVQNDPCKLPLLQTSDRKPNSTFPGINTSGLQNGWPQYQFADNHMRPTYNGPYASPNYLPHSMNVSQRVQHPLYPSYKTDTSKQVNMQEYYPHLNTVARNQEFNRNVSYNPLIESDLSRYPFTSFNTPPGTPVSQQNYVHPFHGKNPTFNNLPSTHYFDTKINQLVSHQKYPMLSPYSPLQRALSPSVHNNVPANRSSSTPYTQYGSQPIPQSGFQPYPYRDNLTIPHSSSVSPQHISNTQNNHQMYVHRMKPS